MKSTERPRGTTSSAPSGHLPLKGKAQVKRLTASERESLLRLNVALEILNTEPEKLAVRARMVPYARRDLAMMAVRIRKLLSQFLHTIPDDQKMSYVRSLDTASYVVGARRPAGDIQDWKNYGTWLPFDVLNMLLAGCHDHCLMCPMDKAQRQACPLRKALEILNTEPEKLAVRARMVPYARRDLAMMAVRIRKLLSQFLHTIPDDQKMSYVRSLDTASYVVGARRPAGDIQDWKNYGTWLPFDVLNMLLAGCHDHCLMCPMDKAQRRACPLRKALETIPNDTEDREDGDCPFYGLI